MPDRIKKTLVMLKECVVMSLDNILGNRVRSFLTILGILIGVMAVIALITTVSGFSGSLSDSFPLSPSSSLYFVSVFTWESTSLHARMMHLCASSLYSIAVSLT